MSSVNLVQCKRCGASDLAWVKSQRTGKFYLALTQKYHGIAGDYTQGRRGTPSGTTVMAHRPHKCDDPQAAGRPVCVTCGQRHSVGSQLCLVNQRAAAKANPVWDVFTGRTGTVRHTLDAGDYRMEVEQLVGEPITLNIISAGYGGGAVSKDGVTYSDLEVSSIDEGRALAETFLAGTS